MICGRSTSVLAYFLHDLSPFIIELHNGFGLRWYGLAYVLAFVVGHALYKRLAERGYTDMPPENVQDFITWAAVFGVMLGGRLGWVIFYGWDEVRANPLDAFKVWQGGMASHGGILGLVVFTLYYARRHHLSWTSIGDSLVCVAPVGIFFVRCANFINGELWGKESKVRWAVQFPGEMDTNAWLDRFPEGEAPLRPALNAIQHDAGVRKWLQEILPSRHPSQIYEALLEGALLFSILWLMRTRMKLPRGVLTGTFFLLYAVLRIAGETFRVPDPKWSMGQLSAGQTLSLFMIPTGICFVVWGLRTRHYERIFLRDTAAAANGIEKPVAV